MQDNHPQKIPCWLSRKDAAIAQALIDAGFTYFGTFSDLNEDETNSCPICTFHGWKLGVTIGEPFLDVFADGVLYYRPLKADTREDFDCEVEKIKDIIYQAVRGWESEQPQIIQLSLFDLATETGMLERIHSEHCAHVEN